MRPNKLSKSQQEDITSDLIHALVQTKSIEEVILFLQDLITKKEMEILSRRLRIAKLLIVGMTYDEIKDTIHVSHTTIAKIGTWLAEQGDGFRNIITKLPKETTQKDPLMTFDWKKFKRKYSLYFWPELLLQEIVKSANSKQKEQIKNVLDKLEEKSDLHREIEKLLLQNSTTR